MTIISFSQFLSYNAFTITGSTVYVPSITPIEGSGNQWVIPSGSVQTIINVADNYIVPLITKDTVLSGILPYDANLGSSDVISLAQSFALDYTNFIFWITMYGGVITGGWDYRLSELDIKRIGALVPSVRGMIEGYKLSAHQKLNLLQPYSLTAMGERVEDFVSNTAPSFY